MNQKKDTHTKTYIFVCVLMLMNVCISMKIVCVLACVFFFCWSCILNSDHDHIAAVSNWLFSCIVEQRKQPSLRGQPTAVVQYNSWQGGALIAVSYEARKFGVKR